jgi:hypothetical protein
MPELTRPDPDSGDETGSDERDRGAATGTPRWVKVFGIIAVVLVLVVVVLLLVGGNHGPGRHTGGDAPTVGVTKGHVMPAGGHG